MHRRLVIISIVTLIALSGFASPALAQGDTAYTEYTARPQKQEIFWIAYDDESIQLRLPTDNGPVTYEYLLAEVEKGPGTVRIAGGNIVFNRDQIIVGADTINYHSIIDVRILDEEELTLITFFGTTDTSSRIERLRRGNIISPFDGVTVEVDQFVRGLVFTVNAPVEVYGEVNKDIVALFSDVYLAPDATARGDIASITGDVDRAGDASVYGDIFTGDERRRGRGKRFWREENEFDAIIDGDYNRVDGITLLGGAKYHDPDSLLPSAEATFGYAFESERTRWNVSVEQVLWRHMPIAIGAQAYRRLADEDDWIISRTENLAFVMLASEDYRDYWEADGGQAYVKVKPIEDMVIQAGYGYEETRWFEAERDLWSLFGWDKKLPPNFRRLDPAFRQRGIREIDTSSNGFLSLTAGFDQRDEEHPFDLSAWVMRGMLEWSGENLGGDFDYHRYRLQFQRYQKIHRRAMIIGQFVFGNSDGYLPMHKRFYLGGLGTLRGYDHKELVGTRFWMLNGEYRFRFPHTDLAASLLYDVAQIANDTELDGDIEVKHSLGVAAYVGDDFRLSVAKRLDRSGDDAFQLYVRLAHSF